MLNEHDWLALAALESGAVMNTLHTTSRSLVARGLAYDSWGRLEISEEGRRVIRSRNFGGDDNAADLSQHFRYDPAAQPMGPPDPIEAFNNPDARPGSPAQPPPRQVPGTLPVPPKPTAADEIVPELGLPVALEPAADDFTRGLRAAGVATGITGITVEARWVHEFVRSYTSLLA